MTFNSVEYLLFLPLVALLYFSLPNKFRWILLLFSSYFFYMYWKPVYGILLLLSTTISFYSALMMDRTGMEGVRKIWLGVGISSDIMLLSFFKYFNFLNESFSAILNLVNVSNPVPSPDIILPIGISFYTFQSLSYIFDVYRKKRRPENHFGFFALYISFFPQLVAGPIERSDNLIPQLKKESGFSLARTIDGCRLILWGLFKKIVIADTISIYIGGVFDNLYEHSGLPLIICLYLFLYQVYCDFSGYTDIAIGSARIFGINLFPNFNKPFMSRSYNELWSRWHISLTNWFKDYVYAPLGGNRTKWIGFRNVVIVFALAGLWHGPTWNFLIFGLFQGFLIVLIYITKGLRQQIYTSFFNGKVPQFVNWSKTFIVISLFSTITIFYRTESMPDALYIVKNLFVFTDFNINTTFLSIIIALIAFVEIIQFVFQEGIESPFLKIKNIPLRYAMYLLMIFSILINGSRYPSPFYYFQF